MLVLGDSESLITGMNFQISCLFSDEESVSVKVVCQPDLGKSIASETSEALRLASEYNFLFSNYLAFEVQAKVQVQWSKTKVTWRQRR